MNILVTTPAPRGSHKGNRVTALRWAGQLRALGHHVGLAEAWTGQRCDLLVALHATKSHPSVVRYREARPDAPLVVGLAGTDLYQDLPASPLARRSLELATRLTLLQPLGMEALPPEVRHKARTIFQSAHPARPAPAPPGVFRVCLLAHIRAVKDAFLAADAVRRLPARSRVELVHLGAALDPGADTRARLETEENGRYRWLGERRRSDALATLAGSALLLVTSRLEGGSNAVSEALASRVPVLSTRVDGSVGVLGPDYPGFFPVGDAGALAELLLRAEEDAALAAALRAGVERARPLVEPARERAAWRDLLAELW
ncbi:MULTISPECIES: selenoneine biosynthesis selenosugar synthase SenB [unclassified Anaeromyxobacter]|uniref:selenoneine biosynthesis selenosugar synthase SenB n=1 Tax=unclassified Anaeromyxobacter TaxID=2620896 RepID=UPI001F5846E5|nr:MULTISPECIES: selenoneine biosynthesis selenosugar synthase SenB [unclassified Anaeromyxobacter]